MQKWTPGKERVFRLGIWQYKEYYPHNTKFWGVPMREKINSVEEGRGTTTLASEAGLEEWVIFVSDEEEHSKEEGSMERLRHESPEHAKERAVNLGS